MTVRLDKPWSELTDSAVSLVSSQLGVYELANRGMAIIYIGYAGGRSLFGLKSELKRWLAAATASEITYFRYEVNMQYTTRYKELLMIYLADNQGELPRLNVAADRQGLGHLMPISPGF